MVHEPTYEERFPEWRSSDGGLKEKKSEGREEVTGYHSSEQERRRGDEPQKIWDLSNAYGSLAAGWNKKKELVLVTSRQHTKGIHSLPLESKYLDGQTATKIPGGYQINENTDRQAESAFSFRTKADRGAFYIMSRLKMLAERHDLEVQKTMLPFLNVEEEKEELAYLRQRARKLLESSDREEEQAVRKRIEFLTAVVAEKEQQQGMLYGKLPDLLAEARKGGRKDWDFTWLGKAEPEAEPDGDESGTGDESGSEDEDEN
jgi:hypothetical protein